MKRRRNFLERLAGTIKMSDPLDDFDVAEKEEPRHIDIDSEDDGDTYLDEEYSDLPGELAVDVYEIRDDIMIQAVTAGVRKGDLDISLTREELTINGTRTQTATTGNAPRTYFWEELYWGAFTRTIALPAEVDIEEAEAKEENGLLTIKLPKINKDRRARLKVQ